MSNDDGSTLLEILVVLAILALAAAATSGLRGPGNGRDAQRVAGELAGHLDAARRRAVGGDIETHLHFDLPGRRVVDERGLTVATMSPSLSLDLTAIPDATIRFSPDGRSTGGTICLDDGIRRAVLRVAWRTGLVEREGTR